MAFSTEAFLTDLRATLRTAFPEVSEISEVEHLDKLVEKTDLTLPYIGVRFSGFQPWADQPADTNYFTCVCGIYYLMQVQGANSGLRGKCETIVSLYGLSDPTPLGDGQVTDVGPWGFDDEERINLLLAAANHIARAGRVDLNCIVGETP